MIDEFHKRIRNPAARNIRIRGCGKGFERVCTGAPARPPRMKNAAWKNR
jgi:hypothetical protein